MRCKAKRRSPPRAICVKHGRNDVCSDLENVFTVVCCVCGFLSSDPRGIIVYMARISCPTWASVDGKAIAHG